MPYPTVVEWTARYGTPDDSSRITALLADAQSLVQSYVGTKYDNPTPAWVVGLVCGVVNRAVNTPGGMQRSVSFVDAYTASWTGDSAEGVWLTSDELMQLQGPVVA